MKNIYVAIVIALIIVWGSGLFLGYIKTIGKGFEENPQPGHSDAQKLHEKQKQIMKDAEDQRKRLMEDYQRKIRDNQRRSDGF